jgi:hypothetical protein
MASHALRWDGPAQDHPTVIDVPDTGLRKSLSPRSDYLLVMPPRPVDGDISLDGGRHVRIVGGTLDGSLKNNRSRGSLFVEGLEIRPDRKRDAIVLGGANDSNAPSTWTRPDLYLQNTRITGVSGSYDGFHADVVQKQGPMGGLYVDRSRPRRTTRGSSSRRRAFRAASPRRHPGPSSTACRSPTSREPTCARPAIGRRRRHCCGCVAREVQPAVPDRGPWPITLDDVWLKGGPAQPLGTWSGPARRRWNDRYADRLRAAADELSGTWPPSSKITGAVHAGDPPSGDFAPAGIGRDYTSPAGDPAGHAPLSGSYPHAAVHPFVAHLYASVTVNS